MAKKRKRKHTREPEDHYEPPCELDELPREVGPTHYKTVVAFLVDPIEVLALIQASMSSIADVTPSEPKIDYNTYSEEEVCSLCGGTYHPRKSKKKK